MNSKSFRHIRSFVRREGRLTPGQENALQQLWPLYGIEFVQTPLNLDSIFQRQAAKVMEIGFGNGDSLAQMAAENPNLDFIGIEVHRPGVGHLLQLLHKQEIDNVRLLCHDAVEVLQACIKNKSIIQCSVFFPDPWPKNRHHKRRLLQTGFLEKIAEKLVDRGLLHIATDWADYAKHVQTTMDHISYYSKVPTDLALKRPDTKYQRRGLKKGHNVYDLVYRLEKMT